MDLLSAAANVVLAAAHLAISTPDAGPQTTASAARAGSRGEIAGLIENWGQWDDKVLFFGRGAAAEVTLVDDALVFRGAEGNLVLRLPQAAAEVVGVNLQRATTSYFQGQTAVTGARSFGSVRYEGVAPGVDLVVRPDGPSFAYDLMLAPGADLESLVLRVEGVSSLSLTDIGDLRLLLPTGPVDQRIGACWQVDPATGDPVPVNVRYRLAPDGDPLAFGFEAPEWASDRPLVIDPTILYCTYLGTQSAEDPRGIAVDEQGHVYVISQATPEMPVTPGAFQSDGLWPTIWIGKFSPDAGQLLWGTFLGGSDTNVPVDVAVDSLGIVVLGQTWSPDFPVTLGSYQSIHNEAQSGTDGVVARLDRHTGHLTHGTFFGGENGETPTALTLLPNGDIVFAVKPLATAPSSLQATPGAFDTIQDAPDKLIVRMTADLSQVVFATWFPIGRVLAVATDADGNVYFAGDSNPSTGPIPVTPGAFQTVPGDTKDGVVGKLDPTGSQLLWCTYFGGDKADTIWDMTVDAARCVYVVGQTASNSTNFPTTPGAFSNGPTPGGNGFAARILADGSGLVWSTYIGSAQGGAGHLEQAKVDDAGNLTAAGFRNQIGWPTTADALHPTYMGAGSSGDVVLVRFNTVGSQLVYSTYLGGFGSDGFPLLDLDSEGRPHVAYQTFSAALPTTPGAYQPDFQGNGDIGLVALDLPLAPWRLVDAASKFSPHIPNLVGMGDHALGSATRLSVRGGKPFGLAWMVLGASPLSVPLPQFGFTLYPWPDFQLPFVLGPAGEWDAEFASPASMADVYFQLIGFDPEAPGMLYASNGLRTAK